MFYYMLIVLAILFLGFVLMILVAGSVLTFLHRSKREIRKAVLRIYRDGDSDVVVLSSSCDSCYGCHSDYLFDSYRNAKLFGFVKRMMLVYADDVTDKGNGSFSLWVSCLSRSERRELRDLVFAARREKLEKRSLKKRAENTAKIEEAFFSVKD